MPFHAICITTFIEKKARRRGRIQKVGVRPLHNTMRCAQRKSSLFNESTFAPPPALLMGSWSHQRSRPRKTSILAPRLRHEHGFWVFDQAASGFASGPGYPLAQDFKRHDMDDGILDCCPERRAPSLRSRRASKVDRQEVRYTSYVVRNCPRRLFSLTGQPIHVLEAATEEVMTQATLVVSFLRTVELRWRLFGETCKPICHEGAQEEPIDPVRKLLGIPLLG